MGIRERARQSAERLSDNEKLEAYERIFKRCGQIVMNASTGKKKGAKAMVSYREDIEWLDEIDRAFDMLPKGLCKDKSAFLRAMNRVALFIIDLLIKSHTEENEMPEKLEEVELSLRLQIMLHTLEQNCRIGELSDRYNEIRDGMIRQGKRGLPTRLGELEKLEARHIESLAPSATEDDQIANAALFGGGYLVIEGCDWAE